MALAAAYGLLASAQYSAHGQILIDPRDRMVLSNDVNPTAMSPDGGVAQVESQTKVLESSGVLLRAIEMLNLENDDEFGVRPRGTFGGMIRDLLGLQAATPKGEASAIVLRALRQKLGIQRADKVFVIDVAVTARDPDKAAAIVNAILKSYLADQAQARADSAVEASTSLSGGLERQRDKVQAAENALERYKAENGIVEANNILVSDQELARLASQLSAAQASTALLRTRLDRAAGGGDDTATAEAMNSATIAQLRSQEATLVQQLAGLQRQFGPRHPSLRNVSLQLSDLRQLIAGELARLKRSSSNDYQRALAYEKSLADALEIAKQRKAESDQVLIGMRALERDLEVSRTVYASFSQRAQETGEQSGIDSTNARVISWALPPLEKSWPKPALFVIAAAAGGLGLGAFAALLAEYRAPTIVSRSDMRRISGAAEVGVIALDPARRRPRLPMPRLGRGSTIDRETDVAMARALVLLQGGGQSGGRSIFLTSGHGENEERVTVVLMLATIALRMSRRVLFIDGSSVDLSNPHSPGVAEILRGEQSLGSAIVIDHATGLAVLGRGRGVWPSNGAGSDGFERLLAEAAGRFDLVIIDGSVVTDDLGALPIAAGADEVVFVARLGSTRREEVTMAADVLGTLGRRISATLLIKPAALI